MKLKRKLLENYSHLPLSAKASLWFLFANIFQKAMMVIFTPVFTRMLTAEEFSKYAVFQSWEAIFSVFATLSISNYATAKALVEFKNDRDAFVSSAESLTILLTIFVFGIYGMINNMFGGLADFPVWIMMFMFLDILTTAVFSFWSQVERFNLKYRTLAAVSILMGILSPLIAFLLIIVSDITGIYRGWARILGLVITDGAVGIVLLTLCFKRNKTFFSPKYWKFCFSYCIPLIPHFLAMAFLQKVGQLFVDDYCGSEASGIYSLGNSLAMLMMVVNDALTKTLVPWTYQKMADKQYKDINKPVILALSMIAVVDLAMAVTAPEIVAVFASDSYAKAIYVVPVLVAVCYFGFLYNTFANIEYYFKETKLVSLASIVAGMVIILFNVILVPRFGFISAAYASLLSYIVYAIMHFLLMKKTLKKHLNGIAVYNHLLILKISIAFVIIILFIPFLYPLALVRYIAIAGVCIIMLWKHKTIINHMKSVF